MSQSVAFISLSAMDYPMAAHLPKKLRLSRYGIETSKRSKNMQQTMAQRLSYYRMRYKHIFLFMFTDKRFRRLFNPPHKLNMKPDML